MKKKILKLFLIIIILILVLYFVYSLITAKVCFDIYSEMKRKVNEEQYFYGKTESYTDPKYVSTVEFCVKDNVYVDTIENKELSTGNVRKLKLWQKCLPNNATNDDSECYIFIDSNGLKVLQRFGNQEDVKEPEDKMYRYEVLKNLVLGSGLSTIFDIKAEEYTYGKIWGEIIKNPTIFYASNFEGQKCYKIKNMCFNSDGMAYYINQETKMPVAITSKAGIEIKYSYFTKEVTDEDIERPDLKEYGVN